MRAAVGTRVMVLVLATAAGCCTLGAAGEPEHGETRNTVSQKSWVGLGSYGMTLEARWKFLAVDTRLAPADAARGVEFGWSDIYSREPDTRWVRDKSASGKARQLWKGTPPGSAAGRRVYAEIGGGFSAPGGKGGSGGGAAAGTAGRTPDWLSLAVDVDIDVDSDRDGMIDTVNSSGPAQAEDVIENDWKANPMGAVVTVGGSAPLVIRGLMKRQDDKGRPLSALIEGGLFLAPVDTGSGGNAGEVALSFDDGGIARPAVDARTRRLAEPLWQRILSGDDVTVRASGVKPGPVELQALLSVRPLGGTEAPTEFTDVVNIRVLMLDLVVDSDNNRTIEPAKDNAVEGEQEFLFWVNEWAEGRRTTRIWSRMELVDYAQLLMSATCVGVPQRGFRHVLQFVPDAGQAVPALALYARPTSEDRGYLKNQEEATTLVRARSTPFLTMPPPDRATGITEAPVYFDLQCSDVVFPMIFTASSTGTGRLRLVLQERVADRWREVAADEVKMRIVRLEQLYSKLDMRQASGESYLDNRPSKTGPECVRAWMNSVGDRDITWNIRDGKWGRRNDRVLVHVHGFNVTDPSSDIWAKDLYRRLYWQGYASPFVIVSWNGIQEVPNRIDAACYNADEFNAFQTGHELSRAMPEFARFVRSGGKDQIILSAHSLGAVVANQAIKDIPAAQSGQPFPVNTLIMMEGAVSAQAFRDTAAVPPKRGDSRANFNLWATARAYGYPKPLEAKADLMWEARWTANPLLAPGNRTAWWDAAQLVGDNGQLVPIGQQPGFVDYTIRWSQAKNNDPWGGYFFGNIGKVKMHNLHSINDFVVSFIWRVNNTGLFFIYHGRKPDNGADDNDPEPGGGDRSRDWPEGTLGMDIFDEDLPEQRAGNTITAETRNWAELAYYFCPLQMPSGGGPLNVSGVTDQECSGKMGIEDHFSMRIEPYYKVWPFFVHLIGLVQPALTP